MIEKLAIAIPLRGDEAFKLCLTSLLNQVNVPKVMDLYIYESSDFPIFTKDKWVGYLIKLLNRQGVKINYQYSQEAYGIAHARCKLFETIGTKNYDAILSLDSDMILEPGAICNMVEVLEGEDECGFVTGNKLELNPDRQWDGDLNDNSPVDICPAFVGDGGMTMYASTSLVFIDWEHILKSVGYKAVGGEDIMMSLMVSNSIPCYKTYNAVGYHMSFDNSIWNWFKMSDVNVKTCLTGVVKDEILEKVFTNLEPEVERMDKGR